MKKMKLLVSLMFTGAFLFTSCSSGDDASETTDLGGSPSENEKVFVNIISTSESPVMGISLDLGQLLKKSDLKNDPESGQMISAGMMQLEAVGLNIDSKVYVLVEGSTVNDARALIMGSLADGNKMAETLKNSGEATVSEEDGLHFVKMSIPGGQVGDVTMVMNKNLFVAAVSMAGVSKDDLKAILKRGAEDGGNKDAVVADFYNDKSDMAMFMKYDKLMTLIPKEALDLQKSAAAGAPDLDKMLAAYNGASSNMTMNFVDGAIELKVKNNFPAMGDMQLFGSEALPEKFAMLASPNNDVFAFGGISLNPKGYVKMMEEYGVLNMAEVQAEAPVDIMKMIDLFTGSLMVSAFSVPEDFYSNGNDEYADLDENFENLEEETLPGETAEEETIEDTKRKYTDYIFALGITDAAAISGILDTAKQIKKTGDFYSLSEGAEMYYIVLEDAIVATGNKEVAATLATTKALPVNSLVKGLLGKPVTGFMNFEMAAKNIPEDTDAQTREMLENLSGIYIDGDMTEAVMRIELKDKSANALKVIVKSAMKGGLPM